MSLLVIGALDIGRKASVDDSRSVVGTTKGNPGSSFWLPDQIDVCRFVFSVFTRKECQRIHVSFPVKSIIQ